MKLWIQFLSFTHVTMALALDPLYPPDVWEEHRRNVLEGRVLEDPIITRPKAGAHPIVAIQTLELPGFTLSQVPLTEALAQFYDACKRQGVDMPIYLDSRASRNGHVVTIESGTQPAAEILRIILSSGAVHLEVFGDRILAGFRSGESPIPLRVGYEIFVLSEALAKQWFPGLNPADSWHSVEERLIELGVSFPSGTFADYRADIRALVAITYNETVDSLREFLGESEARLMVADLKPGHTIAKEGYSLEFGLIDLRADMSAQMHSRLFDANGKLVPFAASTMTQLRWWGMLAPKDSAAWLDVKSSRLLLLNRPDQLQMFREQLPKWTGSSPKK